MRNTKQKSSEGKGCLVSRRNFIVGSSMALATTTVMLKMPGRGDVEAAVTKYPRKKIGSVKALKQDKPVSFNYPDDGASSGAILVKLGTTAGGGMGKGRDIVAFNTVCTHQGGPLAASYKAETKSLGACPFHLTTYDLTRHGIIISGQAYQSLPQVMLEVQGDDIFAVGMIGLIFGRYDNLKS